MLPAVVTRALQALNVALQGPDQVLITPEIGESLAHEKSFKHRSSGLGEGTWGYKHWTPGLQNLRRPQGCENNPRAPQNPSPLPAPSLFVFFTKLSMKIKMTMRIPGNLE